MTAGRGITHSERFEKSATPRASNLHGIQAWVATARRARGTDPAFSHHAGADLPQWSEAGVTGTLIAGSAYGLTAGVKTHSPLFYVHLDLAAGAIAEIPTGHTERALYIATGSIEAEGETYGAGKMLVLGAGAFILRALRTHDIDDPRRRAGRRAPPLLELLFRLRRDRLSRAASDWKAGRMKLPDADDQEFIPLPDSPPPPAPPAMS